MFKQFSKVDMTIQKKKDLIKCLKGNFLILEFVWVNIA